GCRSGVETRVYALINYSTSFPSTPSMRKISRRKYSKTPNYSRPQRACGALILLLVSFFRTSCDWHHRGSRHKLDVKPQEVITGQTESADRWLACEANMRPVPVVAMEPSGQRGISLL